MRYIFICFLFLAGGVLQIKADDEDWVSDVATGIFIDICSANEGCNNVMGVISVIVMVILISTMILGCWSLLEVDWSDIARHIGWTFIGYASSRGARKAFRSLR